MIDPRKFPRLVLVSARTLPPGLAVSTETGVLIASSYLLQAVEFGDRLVNLPVGVMLNQSYLTYKYTGRPGWEGWKFYGGYGKEED